MRRLVPFELFTVDLLGGTATQPLVGGGVLVMGVGSVGGGDQDRGERSLGRLSTKATIPVRTTIRATMPATAAV